MSKSKIIMATGATGALGLELQKTIPANVKFIGTSMQDREEFHLDVTDLNEVKKRIATHNPDIIFHLAAVVPIPAIEKDPDRAFIVNVLGLNNLLRAIEAHNPKCKVVVLSSSEVYGNRVLPQKFIETDAFNPSNFYAFTKVSQEELSLLYLKRGLNIKIARVFNYSSVYKKPIYSLESFANQILSIIRDNKEKVLTVGNLQPMRDFLQGEDVATALYDIALSEGDDITFNVCSGEAISMHSLLQKIIDAFGVEIKINIDKSKFRLVDNMYVCGDNSKLKRLGWRPKHNFDDMINKLVVYQKQQLSV